MTLSLSRQIFGAFDVFPIVPFHRGEYFSIRMEFEVAEDSSSTK